MQTNLLLFQSKSDDLFVLDLLMELSTLKKCPAQQQKSTFQSKALLKAAIEAVLLPECSIAKHKFDLLNDTKLALHLQSEKPLQFDQAHLKKLYAETGLNLYWIGRGADQNYEIRNLLDGHVLKVTSDARLFSRLMYQVFPFWKELLALEYYNRPLSVPEPARFKFLLDQFDAILNYSHKRQHNKEWCWRA